LEAEMLKSHIWLQLMRLYTPLTQIHALALIGTEDAFETIDRHALATFLMRMKLSDGSFRMHDGGEVDVRGSYCALSVAHLVNIVTPQLTDNVGVFVKRCQTYEGGIGAVPGVEAHGGYTFCALAASTLVGGVGLLDTDSLRTWIARRQMSFEGGFNGRINKLVGNCD
jgi:protein farnesyltransferase subunit beta